MSQVMEYYPRSQTLNHGLLTLQAAALTVLTMEGAYLLNAFEHEQTLGAYLSRTFMVAQGWVY